MASDVLTLSKNRCAQCSTIDPCNPSSTKKSLSKSVWFDKYPEFPALKASAVKGCCDLCGLLRHALLHFYSDTEIAKAESDYDEATQNMWPKTTWNGDVKIFNGCYFTEEYPTGHDRSTIADTDGRFVEAIYCLDLTVWPYPPRAHHESLLRSSSAGKLQFEIYTQPCPTPSVPVRRTLPSTEALSSTNVKAINDWLDSCSKNHTECRQESPGTLPTRVIDVGPADDSQDPKLVVTAGESPPYVILSHCWGKPAKSQVPRNARTLSGNLQDMQSAIPLSTLPQNFQDATATVRALGLRYLWIDALCIVQDSKRDWELEAARMGDYYGSAYITLVATSARSSIDGFLTRSPWPWPSVTLPYCIEEAPSEHPNICFRYQPELSKYTRTNAIDNSTWDSRGWTLQERVLSNRTLHFAQGRLFWECRNTKGSEENRRPREIDYYYPWIATEAATGQPLVYPDAAGFDHRYERWYRLVTIYSRRELSYEADILPALSGLAQTFRRGYTEQDEYVAGLWRADLLSGLLWMTMDSSSAIRPSEYRAPSWSWASVKGEVNWPSRSIPRHCRYDYTAKLLEAKTNTELGAPMGAVSGGTLQLLGKLQRLDQVAKPSEWGAFTRFRYDLVFGEEPIGNGAFDVDSEARADDVWILQTELQGPGDSYFPYHPNCLLLNRLDDEATRFSRIGYGALNEDYIAFFNDVELKELCLV